MSFKGFKTAIRRGAVVFNSSRIQNSSRLMSMRLSRLATPILSQKVLMLDGVYPFLLNPDIVGIRGSSNLKHSLHLRAEVICVCSLLYRSYLALQIHIALMEKFQDAQ